jgi:hypothetical protein
MKVASVGEEIVLLDDATGSVIDVGVSECGDMLA